MSDESLKNLDDKIARLRGKALHHLDCSNTEDTLEKRLCNLNEAYQLGLAIKELNELREHIVAKNKRGHIILNDEAFDDLVANLDFPPNPNNKLLAAAKRFKELNFK